MRSRSSSLPTGTTCAGSTWTAPTTHCLSRCPSLSHAYQLPGPSTASPVLPTRAHGCLLCPSLQPRPPPDAHGPRQQLTSLSPFRIQGLNNAVALDFDYREQMIYWTDVTTQGSMIRRMHLNGSNVQVKEGCPWSADLHTGGPTDEPHSPPHAAHVPINTASAPSLSHTNILPVLASSSLNTECKHRDPPCLTPLRCAVLCALGVCRCSWSPW